jgi:hypothetical protein
MSEDQHESDHAATVFKAAQRCEHQAAVAGQRGSELVATAGEDERELSGVGAVSSRWSG